MKNGKCYYFKKGKNEIVFVKIFRSYNRKNRKKNRLKFFVVCCILVAFVKLITSFINKKYSPSRFYTIRVII